MTPDQGILYESNEAYLLTTNDSNRLRQAMLSYALFRKPIVANHDSLSLSKINPLNGNKFPEPPHEISIDKSLDLIYAQTQDIHSSYEKYVIAGTSFNGVVTAYEYFSILHPEISSENNIYDTIRWVGLFVTTALVSGLVYKTLDVLPSIYALAAVSSQTQISFPALFAYTAVRNSENLIDQLNPQKNSSVL